MLFNHAISRVPFPEVLFQEVWDEFQESGYLPCLGSADSLHSLSVKDDETKTEQN